MTDPAHSETNVSLQEVILPTSDPSETLVSRLGLSLREGGDFT